MFEGFTEGARQVVVLAHEEARALGHGHIGTEHLLLGLLREEDGVAARVLASFEIALEEVRPQVVRLVGTGEAHGETGQIPFTPRAKHALELALRERLALGHDSIGTEHVLLGLIAVGEGVAEEILRSSGADMVTVRTAVIRTLGGSAEPRPAARMRVLGRSTRLRLGLPPVALVVTGWLLFAAALGIGVLVGWAIWGT